MDYESLTVVALRADLKSRGLSVAGKKSELIERLQENDDEGAPATTTTTKKPAPKRGKRKAAEDDDDNNDDEEEPQPKPKPAKKSASEPPKKKKKAPVDKDCELAGDGEVYEDYDVMLNQTNISGNNNKYYIIQLIESGGEYFVWTHWGRVGESGQNNLEPFDSVDDAISGFEKKFQDKTKNKWANRDNFKPASGKYTIVEIEHGDDDDDDQGTAQPKQKKARTNNVASKLDKATQDLVKTIFSHDMFNNSMKEMEIDVEKMPLGKLTKSQVQKGHDALQDLAAELDKSRPSKQKISELSSRFYTLIPHSFGRRTPPAIDTAEALQKKIDLLNTLADIEVAQSLLKTADDDEEEVNELDRNYGLLKNELRLLSKTTQEYKVLDQYMKATSRGGSILNIWALDRQGEKDRMDKHSEIDNRKLLWHGTSPAVVVAILSTGLRIMPHSGGRVGRGIYHASEQSKSAGYTGTIEKNVGFMFLNEVALGKPSEILKDNPSLKAAPKGYDSVWARGQNEPDPSKDTTISGEWGDIIVPQGKPIPQKGCENSYFDQSEYLVYSESQVRMKYILQVKLY